jgi:hypothetical protein
MLGGAGLGAAVVMAAAFAAADLSAWFRALVFVPLYAGALGFFQYREKT